MSRALPLPLKILESIRLLFFLCVSCSSRSIYLPLPLLIYCKEKHSLNVPSKIKKNVSSVGRSDSLALSFLFCSCQIDHLLLVTWTVCFIILQFRGLGLRAFNNLSLLCLTEQSCTNGPDSVSTSLNIFRGHFLQTAVPLAQGRTPGPDNLCTEQESNVLIG